jgi:hypothetical protein
MSREGAKKSKKACPERMDSVELSWKLKLNCRRKKWGVTFNCFQINFLCNLSVTVSIIKLFT